MAWQVQSLYLIPDKCSSLFSHVTVFMMKWHVLATAGLPFPNSRALLILSCLVRALGVPKDVFSHFIKLHSFLSIVTSVILADKDFGVVLMTLDCLQCTTYKKEICFYLTLRAVIGLLLCFTRSFVFTCSKKNFSLQCSSMACMSWVLRLLCMTCLK